MERTKILKDMAMWGFFLILGILLIAVIIPSQIAVSPMLAKEYITPRTFPNALSVALIVVSVIGIVSSGMKYAKLPKEEREAKTEKKSKEQLYDQFFPYIIFALVLLYGLIFKHLGFIVATVFIPPVILFLLNCRKVYVYAALYGFAALIYVVFTFVLHVPLP